MIWSIKYFRQYLFGHKFVLITDHQPLKWLKSLKDPPPKLARWVMTLQQYDFEVEYRAGKNHANADTMSRISQTCERKESPVDARRNAVESSDQTKSTPMASDQTESTPMVAMTSLVQPTLNLLEAQRNDPIIKQLINWKQANARKPKLERRSAKPKLRRLLNQWDKLAVNNGILMRRWLPKNDESPKLQIVQTGSTIQSAQLPNKWTLGGIENSIQVATPILLAALAGRCQSPHQSM